MLGLSAVACGETIEPPRDVVSDREAPDSTATMDAALDVPGTSDDAGLSADAPGPAQDTAAPALDAPAPPPEGGASNGCCRAFSPSNQAACDRLEPLGPARCNMVDDGTTCTWSLDARCNDAGAAPDASPPMDAGPPPNCCLAISPVNAELCTTLTRFGRDRCNLVDGGGTCRWSGAAVCNPITPTDAGSGMDVATLADARTDALDFATDARDAALDVGPDVEPPGCCLARTGSNGATCRTYPTSRICGLNLAQTCVWSTSPACSSPLGTNGACCIGNSATYTLQCATYSTAAQCLAIAGRCAWRCP
jgi:hypothetical protein